MVGVNKEGTGARAFAGAAYVSAGKTGTAQVVALKKDEKYSEANVDERLRDHALFIAFAPADKPRYAVAVVLEHGVSGSGLASPIARDLLAHALKYDTGARKPFVPKQREVASAEQVKT